MKNLTTQEFKEKVFDYTKSKEFKLIGDKPVIIDFFALWCAPCKMVSPILKELSEEYKDKIEVYEVDVDKEHEVAGSFGIRSIPSILFAPLDGDPHMMNGALPKKHFEDAIHKVLKV